MNCTYFTSSNWINVATVQLHASLGTKEQSKLYILRLIVAKTHKVKANRLLKIVKHFEDSGYKIDSESRKLHIERLAKWYMEKKTVLVPIRLVCSIL